MKEQIEDSKTTDIDQSSGAIGYVNFWNKEKNNDYWSGGIFNLEWNELWPEAKQAIIRIYNSAINSNKSYPEEDDIREFGVDVTHVNNPVKPQESSKSDFEAVD